MSARLTESLRCTIVSRALAHRFDSDYAKLKEKKRQLAQAIYDFTYNKDLQEKMAAMPEGVMPIETTVRFCTEEGDRSWSKYLTLPSPLPCAQSASHGNRSFGFVKVLSAPLLKRFNKLEAVEDELNQARREASQSLTGALKGFSSIQRLLKEWPELEPFIPAEITTSSAKLPVPQVAELNKLFKLPVKEAELKKAA